jgi:putative transposase
MARIARIVAPGVPHLITQRGAGAGRIFFEPDDGALYLELLTRLLPKHGVRGWAYCLLPDQVRLILEPGDERGMALALGEAHRRYATFQAVRAQGEGSLFAGRFSSVAMDPHHLAAALWRISHAPALAGLVRKPQEWRWSSTQALIEGRSGPLTDPGRITAVVGDFESFLERTQPEALWLEIEANVGIGRPVGSVDWLRALEAELGRPVARRRPGRKPKPH